MNLVADYRNYNPIYFILKELFANENIRQIIIYGGTSSSKTYSIAQILYEALFLNEYNSIIFKKESTTIDDTVYNDFKNINLKYGMIGKVEFIKNKIRYKNCRVRFNGLDDSEKVKGLSDYRKIFTNEITKFDIEDYEELLDRMRGIDNQQLIMDFNPISAKHWIKKEVIDKQVWREIDNKTLDNNSKISINEKGNIVLIKTTHKDNYWITGSPCGTYGRVDKHALERYEDLKISNPIRYNVVALGGWGQEENNSPWLYSLKYNIEKIFVDSLPFYKDMPLHISFDFNNDPLSCIVGQHSAGSHLNNKNAFIHILKEYQVSFKDFPDPFIEIKHRIERDFAPKQIFITGDGSGYQGRMGLQAGSRHFYDTIKNVFNLGDYSILAPLSNPKHSASRTNFNTIIHKHPNYKVDKTNCPNLFDDMNLAEATDKNGNGDELRKDREIFKMDILDAKRYYLWTHFNNFE